MEDNASNVLKIIRILEAIVTSTIVQQVNTLLTANALISVLSAQSKSKEYVSPNVTLKDSYTIPFATRLVLQPITTVMPALKLLQLFKIMGSIIDILRIVILIKQSNMINIMK